MCAWRISAWTIHVFTETPSRDAASSIRTFSGSGSRSVIRARRRVVAHVRCLRLLVADEHELRIAAGDPDLDAPAVELARELERRLAERLLEAPAEGRLECDREELRRPCGRLVTESRDAREVLTDCLDVPVDLHGCSMTSL